MIIGKKVIKKTTAKKSRRKATISLSQSQRGTLSELQKTIKTIESMQEKTKKSKQDINNAFENFERVTDQLNNWLKSTTITIKKIKTSKETTAETATQQSMLMDATQQIAAFQSSFNLQYLQLQEKIRIDTRQFNLISSIMKAKHDAAKNALNNVR